MIIHARRVDLMPTSFLPQALFAVGNLAHAIRGINMNEFVDLSTLFPLSVSVEKRVHDSTAKVSSYRTRASNIIHISKTYG
jgi:hypothetical protein